MKRIISLIFIAFIAFSAFAQKITLEQMWTTPSFQAKGVYGIKPMKDGNSYAKSSYDFESGTNYLIKYNYAETNVADTIYSSASLPAEFKDMDWDDVSFSPNENFLLLKSNTERIYRHSNKAEYYVWDLRGKKVHKVAPDKQVLYATFSPDEKKVAYVFENNIYMFDLASGETTAVTTNGEVNKIINGQSDWVYEEEFTLVRSFEWSPNSDKIAFLRFDEDRVVEIALDVFKNKDYPEPYRYKYPKVGYENSIVTIHIYDINSQKTSQINTGEETDIYLPRIKWTKDNNLLSYQRINRLQNQLELIIYDVAKNESRVTLTEKSKTWVDVNDDVRFIGNNDIIWTSEKSGFKHIYHYDINGKLKKQITSGNWEVTDFAGIDEEKGILYYQSAEQGPLERHVYSIKLNGKGKKNLTPQAGWNQAMFGKNMKYFIHTWSDANTPPVITFRRNDGSTVRVEEDNSGLKAFLQEIEWQPKEFFTFKTVDGTELNGWMIKPANFDSTRQHPLMMTVYGGPGSQTVRNAWSSYNEAWFQYLAGQGIVVTSVDNRGTGGRGRDFQKQTYLKLGELETIDQTEAAKFLGRKSFIDTARIGIYGWSYGGYMSSLCLTKSPDVFKLAVAVAPVTDWRWYDNIYTERFMQTVESNPEGYKQSSVLNYAQNMKGEYLLIHGTFDDNVHQQHALELMNKLVSLNKKFDSELYVNKNHGIYGGFTRLHLFTKMSEFILEKL